MIKIICVGKLKETYWRDALQEYQKRLSKYTKLQLLEVNDYATDSIDVTQKKEQYDIEKYIDPKDYVITMEIEGKNEDSITFSRFLENKMMQYPNITFIIGGSYGLSPKIKNRSNYALSFSKMTFPHQMFRIMLLEQIYRAFKIMKNESYHK